MAPKPVEFLTMIIEEVALEEGSKTKRTTCTHKPWAWKWKNAKSLANKPLIKIIDDDKKFLQFISHTPPTVVSQKTFRDSNE